MERELHEEIGIDPRDITGFVCLGLIHDRSIHQPELIFDVTVRQSSDELAGMCDEEHTGVLACGDSAGTIVPFLREARPVAPVAIGALLLHGRSRFGEQWYEDALRAL
jgi:8-oxo-dGTP pyrophosphatase MutT (NUDIX family)